MVLKDLSSFIFSVIYNIQEGGNPLMFVDGCQGEHDGEDLGVGA